MNRNKRILKLMYRMKEEGIESFLIKNSNNVFYLSGVKSSNAWVLIYKEEAWFLTDFRYLEVAEKELKGLFQVIDMERKSISHSINKIIGYQPDVKMGFEINDITYFEYKALSEELNKNIILHPSEGWVEKLRRIKDEEEISFIKEAQKISEKALRETMNYIREGEKEIKIQRILENFLFDFGAEDLAFKTIVAAGKRGSLPHAVPSENKILDGDFVTIDMGCKYFGYCSDMTRTFAVGNVEEYKRKIYNIVSKAQNAALKEIKAGKSARDIDKISRDIIESEGYGQYFGHGLGHSLGIEVHEAPSFSPLSKDYLEENMIMTVEPGIYIPGSCGLRIEDLVVVKKDGIENLTEMEKDLIIL